jgi:NADPH:quinone reductase-like Zn-dependent oxidoreductase
MCEDRAMLAARIHEDGGPEVVVVEEAPDPVVEPGQVLVRLRAASLNHLDVWVRKGLPSVPTAPGSSRRSAKAWTGSSRDNGSS